KAAEQDQKNAQYAREIAGPHARRGPERVVRADHERSDTERHEQKPGIEILRMADRHDGSSMMNIVLGSAPESIASENKKGRSKNLPSVACMPARHFQPRWVA